MVSACLAWVVCVCVGVQGGTDLKVCVLIGLVFILIVIAVHPAAIN